MNNKEKASRIYDKQTRTWFEVTPEQFEEYDRWRTRIRKREQYHKRCMCPRSKWWLCDGMCQDCERTHIRHLQTPSSNRLSKTTA